MPNNLALQVFYGSVPLIVVLVGLYFQNQTMLRDVQARLLAIENLLREWMPKIERRLTTLEVRAGVVYQGNQV